MAELILLDVFSYSCMNCLRSLKHIKKLDSKYKKSGLKTIIIHPPEWDFEKDSGSILKAAKEYDIKFPITADKDFRIIRKLKIDFWPAQVLVKGKKIAYKHVGEGDYTKLENAIRKILKVRFGRIFKAEPAYSRFPTVYCGKRKHGKTKKLDNDKKLKFGKIYSDANWVQKDEYVQSLKTGSELSIRAKGKIINFVAESLGKKPLKICIKLNNKKLKSISINNPQLYTLAKIKNNHKNNKLDVISPKSLAIYSFSFQ